VRWLSYQSVNWLCLSEDEAALLPGLVRVIQVVDLVMIPEFLSPVDANLFTIDVRPVGTEDAEKNKCV
jgi:hypothetical protein